MKRFLGIPVLGIAIQTMPKGMRIRRFKLQFWVANVAVLAKIAWRSGTILGGLSYLLRSAFNVYFTKSSIQVTCFYFTVRVTDTKYMYIRVKK
jgi:hypothetical protein